MAKKLWDKGVVTDQEIERFTIGKDQLVDIQLAPFDVLGSMAHSIMLEQVGLLDKNELAPLLKSLKEIYFQIEKEGFVIEPEVEDVHSQIELILTRRLGDIGKKIHSGRSRNDQVLLDLKLFARFQIEKTVGLMNQLIDTLLSLSQQYEKVLMPGYTHLQIAMPSSFGLWFGAYAESFTDDLQWLLAAYRTVNRNPLGSAAGYGSSFPLNRQLTTDLLGFDSMNYNVVYAQMGRGKMERGVTTAIASAASTLSKLAYDACLYSSQNFGFIQLPDAFTTGSSIMPHKKNPDVFELIRAKCNLIQSIPTQIAMITNNLPSGYFRDMQITKECFIPAFELFDDCLKMTTAILPHIKVNTSILDDPRYDLIFSVENVNRLVLEGMPFREAYKKVADEVSSGTFHPQKELHHTHEGSIGNLCNDAIRDLKNELISSFHFEKWHQAEQALLNRVE